MEGPNIISGVIEDLDEQKRKDDAATSEAQAFLNKERGESIKKAESKVVNSFEKKMIDEGGIRNVIDRGVDPIRR